MSDETKEPQMILANARETKFFRGFVKGALGLLVTGMGWILVRFIPLMSDQHNDGRYVRMGGLPGTGYVTEEERANDLEKETQTLDELNKTLTQHDGWFKAIWEELRQQNQNLYQRSSDAPTPRQDYVALPRPTPGQVPTQGQ